VIRKLFESLGQEMETMTEKRLEELETRVVFQEDTIQKLDDALAAQQQQIMDLERQIQIMGTQIKEIELEPASSGPEAPPPHY
jgi:SlyX protein